MEAQAPIARAHNVAFQSRRDIDEGIQALKVPTLFIYGESGVWPAEVREGIQRRYGVEIRLIPAAGHNVHIDQPEAFNRAVLEFLNR
jgi:pimeloyl-ACP methyl ester carboxylesterase